MESGTTRRAHAGGSGTLALGVGWAFVLLCWACSSDKPAGNAGGSGPSGGKTAVGAPGGSGEASGAGGTPDVQAEAGRASTPAGAGGMRSNAGGSPTDAGTSSGANDEGGAATVGSCANPDSECGGDLTGTWAVSLVCVDVQEVPSGPFEGCEGISYRLMADATIAFGSDNSFQETTTTAMFSGVFEVPKACAAGGSCAGVAADLEVNDASTKTVGEVCEVTGSLDNTPDSHTGTYAVSGNTLVIDDKADRAMTFCVTGNTLVLKSVQERQIVIQTLTRE